MEKQKKKRRKPPVIPWNVNVQFWGYDTIVSARTEGEAKKKAIAKALRKGSALVNRRNTYADKF